MNDLLDAAKAVIDRWDLSKMYVESPIMDELRAAVERAEKQEADFYKWWERTYGGKTCRVFAEDSWKTAQQFERERIKEIIRDVTGGFGNCDRLMEKIDA